MGWKTRGEQAVEWKPSRIAVARPPPAVPLRASSNSPPPACIFTPSNPVLPAHPCPLDPARAVPPAPSATGSPPASAPRAGRSEHRHSASLAASLAQHWAGAGLSPGDAAVAAADLPPFDGRPLRSERHQLGGAACPALQNCKPRLVSLCTRASAAPPPPPPHPTPPHPHTPPTYT